MLDDVTLQQKLSLVQLFLSGDPAFCWAGALCVDTPAALERSLRKSAKRQI